MSIVALHFLSGGLAPPTHKQLTPAGTEIANNPQPIGYCKQALGHLTGSRK
jgi:hypothetical protein